MSDCGDTREQPSIPEDPLRLSFEHLCLAVAVVALTVVAFGLVMEATIHHDLLRGAYSLLAALIVCGVVGFSATLVLRELAGVKALLVEVRDLLRSGPVAPEAEAALRRISMKLLQGGRGIS